MWWISPPDTADLSEEMTMDMLPVFSQMGILFLTAALGFVGAKTGVMDEKSNGVLSKIVLNLTLPCTVLYSALSSDRILSNTQVMLLMLMSAFSALLLIGFSKIVLFLLRIPAEQRGVSEFLLLFSNMGFIGYPILRTIFGSDSVFYAAAISMIYTLLSYSYGVILIRGKGSGKGFTLRDVLSPMAVSSVVACIIYMLKLDMPAFVLDYLKFVDQGTSPFSMIIIGCSMGFATAKQFQGGFRTYTALTLRMLLIPVVCWLLMLRFPDHAFVLRIFAVMYALPAAASTTMFCARYNRDQTLSSSAVLLSTIISALTLPLLCALIV